MKLSPEQMRRLLSGFVNIPGVSETTRGLLSLLRKSPIPQSINKSRRLVGKGRKEYRNIKKFTDEHHPLDTGVNIRKEFFINPETGKATPNMYFGNFRRTPMMDIDVKYVPGRKPSHQPRNITYDTREDALRDIERYISSPLGQMQKLRAYKTPGGIRLIDMKNRMTPTQYFKPNYGMPGGAIKTDPDYITRRLYPGGAFDFRLSPKPGRPDDYVAKFIGNLGRGKPNPKNVFEVDNYHDNLIAAILRNHDNTLGGLFKLLQGAK
tara:strand:+ start:369 stop:1163 length:795 start_codon:yes stop_codon:yes gene_type:complete